MRICLVGLDNLPVLAPEYSARCFGGEPVQQTLLARALARRGHQVSMVVADYGQGDDRRWDGVRTHPAYVLEAGIPVLRFLHPRWTGLWSALARADAQVYYTSCAGMEVGLLSLFCRRHDKPFVFRIASDSDCDPARLLVRYARDRWLYALGLRRADAVLVQSAWQAGALEENYGVRGRVAKMLVDGPRAPAPERDIDVLWVSNIRKLKRPDRCLRLARAMPWLNFHMVGGPLAGEQDLFREVHEAAAALPNVFFHGRQAYQATNALYARARVFLNTSDVEGFPNSFLQAWIRGVPVVSLFDPDRLIAREGLGRAVRVEEELGFAIGQLTQSPEAWKRASDACLAFMAREHGEDAALAPYLETFEQVVRGKPRPPAGLTLPTDAAHG